MIILNEDTLFVIYGAGEVGTICANSISAKNGKIEYFLDANKSGMNIVQGYETFKLDSVSNKQIKDGMVVIVCLADGLIHRDVCRKLYSKGYEYIVFLPLSLCMSECVKNTLTEQYNRILNGNFIGETIQNYVSYYHEKYDINFSILKKNDNLVVLCGVEILFTECLELWTGDKSKMMTEERFKNRSIAEKNPCRELFDFFDGTREDCDLYFTSKNRIFDDIQKNQIIVSRRKLYNIFQKEHSIGLDFFVEGAPKVVFNPRKYFNLVGGHHRTMYLLHKGHRYFPVCMTQEIFKQWCNYNEFEKFIRSYEEIIEQHTFYAPIPHPAFIQKMSRFENGNNTCMEAILSAVARINYHNLTVVDLLQDEGYYARIFDRCGVRRAVSYQREETMRCLCEAMNGLLYRNVKYVCDEVYLEDYDITFCNDKELEYWMLHTNKYIFVEVVGICNSDLLKENGKIIFHEHTEYGNHEIFIIEKGINKEANVIR